MCFLKYMYVKKKFNDGSTLGATIKNTFSAIN